MHEFKLRMETSVDGDVSQYKGRIGFDCMWEASVGIEIGVGLAACGFVDRLAILAHAIENIEKDVATPREKAFARAARKYLAIKEGE